VRASLEPQFRYDFSQVRIHTDAEADVLSRNLGAEAFTTGHDIFFRDGTFRPDSESGKGLIAHELTHVVQQGAAVPALQRQFGEKVGAGAAAIVAEEAKKAVSAKKSTEVPDLTIGTVTKVKAKITAGKKQDAIDLILAEVKASKMPNLDKCEGKTVKYDSSISGEGLCTCTYNPTTNKVTKIVVKVGDKAFSSAAWLYSSMMHEYQHVNQYLADPKKAAGNDALTEFEAYSWEIHHASETGVTKQTNKMKDLGKRMKSQGWDKMTEDEKKANKATYDKSIKIIRSAIGDKNWQP